MHTTTLTGTDGRFHLHVSGIRIVVTCSGHVGDLVLITFPRLSRDRHAGQHGPHLQLFGSLWKWLPTGFPASILVVQHIADGFVPVLVKWLNDISPIRVKEAGDAERLAPGVAYIAPTGVHMKLIGDRIALSGAPPLAGHRPSGPGGV